MLAKTLEPVRKRIAKRPTLNENETTATLIERILAVAGWVEQDPDGVTREGKAPRARYFSRESVSQ